MILRYRVADVPRPSRVVFWWEIVQVYGETWRSEPRTMREPAGLDGEDGVIEEFEHFVAHSRAADWDVWCSVYTPVEDGDDEFGWGQAHCGFFPVGENDYEEVIFEFVPDEEHEFRVAPTICP